MTRARERQGRRSRPGGRAAGHQRRGIGTRLVRAGLPRATTLGYEAVVVLGEPDYYRRFGFQKASELGPENEYGVDEPFMALALSTTGPRGCGLLLYQPELTAVTP